MNGDLREAVRMLAADNARLCDIALAADKLADAIAAQISRGWTIETHRKIKHALEAFKIVRDGQ